MAVATHANPDDGAGHRRGNRPGDGARPERVRHGRRHRHRTAASLAPPAACSSTSARSGSWIRRSRRPAFIGAAIGAAAEGMRPIAELMFVDFFGVCMDQIYNHLAKNTYMAGGNVRLAGGADDRDRRRLQRRRAALAVPVRDLRARAGLKVVVPSNAYDAKGLMIQAIRDDNPVMYFFHKGIMGLPWMAYFEGSTTTCRRSPTRFRSARRTSCARATMSPS